MERDPGVERMDELRVAARLHGRLCGEQADAPVSCRLHGRMRLGRDHAHDRHGQLLLQPRQCGRRGGVAGDEDELHVLPGKVGADLARETADLFERTRAVRQARVVAEVDEILVRHRHEALVEDGQSPDTGVEDAYGPRVHGAHRKGALP